MLAGWLMYAGGGASSLSNARIPFLCGVMSLAYAAVGVTGYMSVRNALHVPGKV